jgi:hypothetical protein
MLFTIFGAIGQCCALCCCLNKIKKKRKSSSTACQKACSIVWILFIFVLFLVGAMTSFTGGSVLATAIYSFQGTIVGTLNSTSATVASLNPSVSATFDNLVPIVSNAVDTTINAVNFQALTDLGVVPNMQSLSTEMRSTNSTKNVLYANGLSFQSNMTIAGTTLTSIVSSIKSATATVASWSATAGVPLNGGTWRLDTPTINVGSLDTQADTCQTNFNSCPDGATQLAPVNTVPNLITYAEEIDVLVAKLTTDVRNTITSSSSNTKTTTTNSLTNAKNSITGSLANMKTDLDKVIDPMIKDVDAAFETVRGYENNRSIAMITFSSFIIVILLVFSIFLLSKKPAGVKGCNLVASPIYILVQLLAIILCVTALVFGDVCTSVFEFNPPPVIKALETNTGNLITKAFTARDRCVANISIITIAGDLGLVDSSQVNVTKLASEQIDSVDFGGLATGFNLASSLSLSNSPTTLLNALINLDTTGLVGTNFDSLATSLTNVVTSLNALRASMESARNGAKTFTRNGVTQSEAETDFNSRSTNLDTTLNGIITSINTFTTTTIPSLKNSVNSLRSSADILKTNAAGIPYYYGNATVALNTFSSNASTNV